MAACVSETIPDTLKDQNIWVLWRYEFRENRGNGGKWTKVPISVEPTRFGHARSNAPSTWTNFETVWREYANAPHRWGIGVMLRDGLCGGDLDDSIVTTPDGLITLKPWAQDIVREINTYTEVSPSGTGVKFLFNGSFEELAKEVGVEAGRLRRRKKVDPKVPDLGEMEFYDHSSPRFFTVTGHHYPSTPRVVESRQAAFTRTYTRVFAPELVSTKEAKTKERDRATLSATCSRVDVADEEVVRAIRESSQAARFERLYSGNIDEHGGDHSQADLALCSILAFWCGRDPERIDRLFRTSGLYRDKWDRQDYRDRTIARALEGREDFYQWGNGDEEGDLEAVVGRWDGNPTEPRKAHSEPPGGIPYDPATFARQDLLNLLEIKRKAETVERVWLAEGWLQAGHLSVMSGREKRGKSTAAYDLMTALLTGQKWLNYVPCVRCPVLLLDYENPVDYVWTNLQRMIDQRGGDYQEISDWYGQIDPDLIRDVASPLVAEYALAKIDQMGAKTGAKSGLVVVDTAAPAWTELFEDPNWTNVNTQVRKALEIGQTIARRSGWHVQIVYHDNKSGTGASGSYEWYGTPDVFLRFERELEDPKGYLSITGRLLDPPCPLEFERRHYLLHARKKGHDQAQRQMEADNQEYLDFVYTLPLGEENALNKSAIEDLYTGKLKRVAVRGYLERATSTGLIQSKRLATKNAVIYWR